jgi:hypothetical protein
LEEDEEEEEEELTKCLRLLPLKENRRGSLMQVG